jgi:hypothetical protein
MWDWLRHRSLGWDWLDGFWLVVLVGMAAYCLIAARGDRKAENRTWAIGFLVLVVVVVLSNTAAGWWSRPTPSLPRLLTVVTINAAIIFLACWFFVKAYRLYKRRLAQAKRPQQSDKG